MPVKTKPLLSIRPVNKQGFSIPPSTTINQASAYSDVHLAKVPIPTTVSTLWNLSLKNNLLKRKWTLGYIIKPLTFCKLNNTF